MTRSPGLMILLSRLVEVIKHEDVGHKIVGKVVIGRLSLFRSESCLDVKDGLCL